MEVTHIFGYGVDFGVRETLYKRCKENRRKKKLNKFLKGEGIMNYSPYVKNIAKNVGRDKEEVNELWEKAKKSVAKENRVKEDNFEEKHFDKARDKVLVYYEKENMFNIAEFMKSDKPARDFVEEAVTVSSNFDFGEGGFIGKQEPYVDKAKEDEEESEKVQDIEGIEKKRQKEEEDAIFSGQYAPEEENE